MATVMSATRVAWAACPAVITPMEEAAVLLDRSGTGVLAATGAPRIITPAVAAAVARGTRAVVGAAVVVVIAEATQGTVVAAKEEGEGAAPTGEASSDKKPAAHQCATVALERATGTAARKGGRAALWWSWRGDDDESGGVGWVGAT